MTEPSRVNPDETGSQPDVPIEPEPSNVELLLDFLDGRLKWLVVLIFLALAAYFYFDYELEIPRFWYVFSLTGIFLIPVGYAVAQKVKSMLIDPNHMWVVDVEAQHMDGAIYRFPFRDFRDIDVTDGSIDQVTPNLAFAKNVDLESGTLEGTWRGSLEDRELLRKLEAISVCRGQLEDDAKVGFTLQTRFWSIIRGATRDTVLDLVATFEESALPDSGKGLEKHVNAAVEQYDLDETAKIREDNLVTRAEQAEQAEPDRREVPTREKRPSYPPTNEQQP